MGQRTKTNDRKKKRGWRREWKYKKAQGDNHIFDHFRSLFKLSEHMLLFVTRCISRHR